MKKYLLLFSFCRPFQNLRLAPSWSSIAPYLCDKSFSKLYELHHMPIRACACVDHPRNVSARCTRKTNLRAVSSCADPFRSFAIAKHSTSVDYSICLPVFFACFATPSEPFQLSPQHARSVRLKIPLNALIAHEIRVAAQWPFFIFWLAQSALRSIIVKRAQLFLFKFL